LKSAHITPRNSPLLLTKVTVTGVLEFWDLAPRTQDAACASVTDRIVASPSAAKTRIEANKDLGIGFSHGVGFVAGKLLRQQGKAIRCRGA
jgi:hypothetical protein